MDEVATIQPVVLRTDNVAKELMRIASSHKIPVSSLDFSLLGTQTFTRTNEGEEWSELSADELHELRDPSVLLSETFEIKQTYEIEIFTKTEPAALDYLELSIGANSTKTKVYITIREGTKLEDYETFGKDFTELINKKKLRANLLILIFDEPMYEAIRSIRAPLEVNETITLEKKEILQVAQGIDPVDTVHDKLILHYENKQPKEDDAGRVDYSKRGYLLSVVEDELLFEYIKPKLGKPGRNCRGEYIEPEEPKVENEPTFNISDNIAKVEDDDHIEYRAKQNGYVTFENATYDIKTEVDVAEISFKTTGSIETDLDADVSINVKEKDVLKDAIGMGMEVEVNELHVEGNVGPNARILAMKALIEGQTHKSSSVQAKNLNINIHKGYAKGEKVDITRLEHGHVEGDVVTVKQAVGGSIYAREIVIETLGSHVKLFASHKITINKLMGGENMFVIDPLVGQQEQQTAKESKTHIIEAERHLRNLKEEVADFEIKIRKNEPAYLDIKKRLIHYKKNGVKMPSAFVKKYREFKNYYERLDSLRGELFQQEEKIERLKAKYHSVQNDILEARIINNDRWRNHNELIFKLVDPPMEVSFVPLHNSEQKIFGLKEREDDYIIAPMDE